jgi:hypothetical protein
MPPSIEWASGRKTQRLAEEMVPVSKLPRNMRCRTTGMKWGRH